MERIPIEVGRVVLSRQGRDAGRYFVITAVLSDDYVLLSDGLSHKLGHPKKKKVMHIKTKSVRMDTIHELAETHRLKDSDVRTFLENNGFGIDKTLCKED